ncbi:hypothetical protein LO772_27655 [Yinghuangia sp. ASG 101]|uniref:hypothetical protein n=1 Tax=Yinghuangia sp. ASG 101 TaxID=2896848 RepID=UPI001E3955B5|nr:hypothetical protein [Yinghuangia sp. ASG 101]UGQ10587.1 hypothetical protein LO772_27655 [Yinghuangia sp. ASG 101]
MEPTPVEGYAGCTESAKARASGDESTVTDTNAESRAEPKIGSIVETDEHGREQVMDVMAKTVFLRPVGGGYERTVSLSGFWRETKS